MKSNHDIIIPNIKFWSHRFFVMDKYMREHFYFEGMEEINSPEKKRNTT